MRFIKGCELSRRFYLEAVYPILTRHFPDVKHAAARLGSGSDVLGYDTDMSMDHDWGPRVQLFLAESDIHRAPAIFEVLSNNLPFEFLGFPTYYRKHDDGTLGMEAADQHPINPLIPVTTVRNFLKRHLDYDNQQPFTPADWLSVSAQTLAEIAHGPVFVDEIGELTAVREHFQWYPHDVWLTLMAASWNRIGEEEHLMPRAGFVGDELGSALIGSRLIRDIMYLCFLMERRYPLYPKWLGTAFRELECASVLYPILMDAQTAQTWQAREAALVQAYEFLARKHNALNITEPVTETVTNFHNRPFRVINGGDIAAAIVKQVEDSDLKRIIDNGLLGNLDQFSDHIHLRSHIKWRQAIKHLLT
ncbi:MAG: DUF4037 domain-containing protein [Chloroflexi bacterium]|nr:DUF4037 domain-containing protein [Chloroflexota bacterium]